MIEANTGGGADDYDEYWILGLKLRQVSVVEPMADTITGRWADD